MRDPPPTAWVLGFLGLYVVISSWVGLTGPSMAEGEIGEAAGFFVEVWTDSLLADLVFIAGTVAAGLGAWWLADHVHPLASLPVAWVFNAATYVAAFYATSFENPDGEGFVATVDFVIGWGAGGLLIAAVLPAIAFWAWPQVEKKLDRTAAAG